MSDPFWINSCERIPEMVGRNVGITWFDSVGEDGISKMPVPSWTGKEGPKVASNKWSMSEKESSETGDESEYSEKLWMDEVLVEGRAELITCQSLSESETGNTISSG